MATMRAKMVVTSVTESRETGGAVTLEQLTFNAVSSKPFEKDGISEDNEYSKWTPSAELKMSITNPAMFGKHKQGHSFYVDFTPAD